MNSMESPGDDRFVPAERKEFKIVSMEIPNTLTIDNGTMAYRIDLEDLRDRLAALGISREAMNPAFRNMMGYQREVETVRKIDGSSLGSTQLEKSIAAAAFPNDEKIDDKEAGEVRKLIEDYLLGR